MVDNGSRITTHGNPGGDKIDLVQDVDQVLVRLLLSQVFDDRLAPGTDGVSRVQHVNDDIGGIEHFVQLSPDTPRGTFGVNRLSHERSRRVVCRVIIDVESVGFAILGDLSSSGGIAELFDRANIETRSLTLGLRAERVAKGLGLDNVRFLLSAQSSLLELRPSSPCPRPSTRPRSVPWAACYVA